MVFYGHSGSVEQRDLSYFLSGMNLHDDTTEPAVQEAFPCQIVLKDHLQGLLEPEDPAYLKIVQMLGLELLNEPIENKARRL